MQTKTELEPIFDTRKSFYKKAYTLTENDKIILLSYNTEVAEIRDGKAKIFDTYSPTTLRHIKEFLYQNGFKIGTKKELEEWYN
ncbi:hypothetical protein WRP3_041 [Lactococcus phage WRP3]|uniref:DUF8033 domain-containing protein n=1 Tax=Lactococcus phage WRP3 TaxID=1560313 RepID=A0A0D3MSR8_9CAUD|nr:hypothetical protein ACQ37_gp041 [Lactococcus phage WRP3]AIX12544.1 hypothetical protein WRP3_041 [Lactococcus phage WRP3]